QAQRPGSPWLMRASLSMGVVMLTFSSPISDSGPHKEGRVGLVRPGDDLGAMRFLDLAGLAPVQCPRAPGQRIRPAPQLRADIIRQPRFPVAANGRARTTFVAAPSRWPEQRKAAVMRAAKSAVLGLDPDDR